MAGSSVQQQEWVDGFLFVGNQLALDFLNTKPILESETSRAPAECRSAGTMADSFWNRHISEKQSADCGPGVTHVKDGAFVQKLIAFRERLRVAVLRLEAGSLPGDAFLAEMDMLLKKHPQRTSLRRKGSKVVLEVFFEPQKPEDVWAPIVAATAELLSESEPSRIRQCESESCIVHFYDTSKKGSRRWCSMNICGNRLKVAAYQRRRRLA